MGSRRLVVFVFPAVVAATVLCLGQAASAAPSVRRGGAPVTHAGSSARAPFSPAALAAPAVVLYDQYDNQAASESETSQDFEAANDALDSSLADDFVVTSGQTWTISGVDVDGEYSTTGPAASVNVFFYANGAGDLPGTLVASASRPGQAYVQGPAPGDFVVTLSPAVSLSSGTYWVSVQARQDSNTAGQWFWHDRSVQSNQGAAWQNPGNGWGSGCTTWTRRTACPLLGVEPDQAFRLNGTTAPTSVRVAALGARSTARGVIVHWRTAGAPEALGFELWRQRGTGQFRKMNRGLIRAKPGVRTASYSFLDAHARRGGLYRYRLRLVTLSGARYWIGVATARVPG
jgi:hypothetical protein